MRRLVVLETTGSTNEDARRLAQEGAPEGTVVLADHQTTGRGRLGRSWYSPPGLGLYASVLLRPSRPLGEVTGWTLAGSLAACEACREVAACEVIIKWPNDLLWNGRKVAGTLAELRSSGQAAEVLVLGTGFNVNQRPGDFPAGIADRAASLRMAGGGARVEREVLAVSYLRRLGRLTGMLTEGEWERVAAAWTRLAPGAWGSRVRVLPGGEDQGAASFEGITRGLSPGGALRVERTDGVVVSLHLGESLIPLEC